jgi:hypothetical protein
MFAPSSVLKFRAGYVFDLIFSPETVGSIFLRNASELLQDYMALNPRKWNSDWLLLSTINS